MERSEAGGWQGASERPGASGQERPDDSVRPRDLWEAFSRPGLDPDAPALGDRTRGEALARIGELAGSLRRSGVRPGEAVALHGPDGPEWIEGLLALTAVGACPLLLPADSPPAETRRLSRAVGAERRLVTGPRPARIEGAPGRPADDREPATLLLASSGSTGLPKSVARGPRSVVDEGFRYHRAGLAGRDDRVLLPLPLSHAYALGWLAGVLVAGAHVDAVPPHAVGAVHTRLRDGATVLVTVPGLARVLVRRRALAEDAPYPALRRVMAGAGYVDAALDQRWRSTVGVGVSRNYGSTETGAVLWGEPGLPAGAVGHPMPGVRVLLTGPGGEVQEGPGQGELSVVLEDGSVHHLHDLAERDADGVHRVLGRARSGVVRRGARWVSTLEIESVLRAAPGVADVAVTATGPDDSDDQGLTVVYVPADTVLAAPERVRAHARAHLAPYKVPDGFRPRYRLRRSAVGKATADPVYRLAPRPGTRRDLDGASTPTRIAASAVQPLAAAHAERAALAVPVEPSAPVRIVADALRELGLETALVKGAGAVDLAAPDGLHTDLLISLLDTACALGLLTTAPEPDTAPEPHTVPEPPTPPGPDAVPDSDAVRGVDPNDTSVPSRPPPGREAASVAGRLLASRVRHGAVELPPPGPGSADPLVTTAPPPALRTAIEESLAACDVPGRVPELRADTPPPPPGPYGGYVLLGGLHGPEPRLGAWAELLRPGQPLLLADAFVGDPWTLDGEDGARAVRWLVEGRPYCWTVPELHSALTASGLQVEDTRTVEGGRWAVVTARRPS
ncbi:class I adenylate-forming enzyme family protein [Streptomyces sp. NPDC058417]|uniref:class I adenylate-forming enzyme family protein n=1 Tax=unclassified Streptomyces TaxID=2593676 RepID=UPI00365AFD65